MIGCIPIRQLALNSKPVHSTSANTTAKPANATAGSDACPPSDTAATAGCAETTASHMAVSKRWGAAGDELFLFSLVPRRASGNLADTALAAVQLAVHTLRQTLGLVGH